MKYMDLKIYLSFTWFCIQILFFQDLNQITPTPQAPRLIAKNGTYFSYNYFFTWIEIIITFIYLMN